MLTVVVFFLLGPVSVLKAQELKNIETLYSTKNINIDINFLEIRKYLYRLSFEWMVWV